MKIKDSEKITYILITAARNEEEFIEKTIDSVVSQTILPKKWVIVNDGSTDRTEQIVKDYMKRHNWIELQSMDYHEERNFGSKALCVNSGYASIKDNHFHIIGNLDADISFDKDFIKYLLAQFSRIPDLGVAGARYKENNVFPIYSFRDVAGQCQMFRRECFEEIGGYFPSKYGGLDNIAVLSARMRGWKTLTFNEKWFTHHRGMSTAESNRWKARIKYGILDYILGNHPLWEVLRIGYQITERPYLIGGLLLMYGYAKALFLKLDRPVSTEFVNFYRREQKKRMKAIVANLIKGRIKLEET